MFDYLHIYQLLLARFGPDNCMVFTDFFQQHEIYRHLLLIKTISFQNSWQPILLLWVGLLRFDLYLMEW
jgi:hypothetical protein